MTATVADNQTILPVQQGNAEVPDTLGTPRNHSVFADPALAPARPVKSPAREETIA